MHPYEDFDVESDPEMAELLRQDRDLDAQTHDLSARLRSTKKDDREKLKAELTVVVTKHFDVRQQRRDLQVKRMEAELQKLRDAMTKRNESRNDIIKKRLTELVGEQSDLEF